VIKDFEITAGLRAGRLTVRVPPDACVEAVGDGVTVSSRQRRDGLPASTRPRDTYADVAVEKRTFGQLRTPPST
jgi:hypothetical protein